MSQPEPPGPHQPIETLEPHPDTAPITRRRFALDSALYAVGLGVLGVGLSGCGGGTEPEGTFGHGVASGDPLSNRVILWTRVTQSVAGPIEVRWEVARDALFTDVVASGIPPPARRATTPSRSTLAACSPAPPTTTVFASGTNCHRSGAPRPCRRVRSASCGLR